MIKNTLQAVAVMLFTLSAANIVVWLCTGYMAFNVFVSTLICAFSPFLYWMGAVQNKNNGKV